MYLFAISTHDLGHLYCVFYWLAILSGSFIILFEAHRQKWHLTATLMIIIWGIVFAMFFSKLLAITIEQWHAAISEYAIPFTAHKTYLGWLLGGYIGVSIARRIMQVKHDIGDPFAIALPIGLAVARVGCLFGGCCFGRPTSVPWSIAYTKHSLAYETHVVQGLISNQAVTSLGVHPVQVYEIMLLITIAIILLRIRHRIQKPGSLFWIYVLLHSLARFVLEFVRQGGQYSFGLKNLQWVLLLTGVISFAIVVRRWHEKKTSEFAATGELGKNAKIKHLLLVLPVTLFIIIARNWFTRLETEVLSVIVVLFLLLFSMYLIAHWNEKYRVRIRTASIGLVMLSIGQTPDTILKADTNLTNTYVDLSFGGMRGKYEEICGDVRSYHAVGSGLSVTWQSDTLSKRILGVRCFVGNDQAHTLYGANPYVRIEREWFGVGLGEVTWFAEHDSYVEVHLLPMVSLRLGRPDRIFIEGRVLDHSPGVLQGFTALAKIGIGICPTSQSETCFRLGISDAGFYCQPFIPLVTNRLSVEPFVAFGGGDLYQLNITGYFRFGATSKNKKGE